MIQGMDDDRLLEEIGQLLRRADPVPSDVTLAARSALAWRRMDAELAELLYDSALEAEPLAGVRSTATGWRVLTFEGPRRHHRGRDLARAIEADAHRPDHPPVRGTRRRAAARHGPPGRRRRTRPVRGERT